MRYPNEIKAVISTERAGIQLKKETRKSAFLQKVIRYGRTAALAVIFTTTTALADNEYAQSGAEWLLDGLFWVVLVLGLFAAGQTAVKRNISATVGILLITGLIAALCQNPEILKTIGEALIDVLNLG